MRIKMSRRVLSLLLVMAMLCGLLFTTAFAADDEHAASEGEVLDALQVENPNDSEDSPDIDLEVIIVDSLDIALSAAPDLAESGIQAMSMDTVFSDVADAVSITNDPSHPWTEDGDGLKTPQESVWSATSMALTLDVQQDGTLAFDYECSLIKYDGQYFKVFVNDEVKLEVSPTSTSSYATFTGNFEQAVSTGDTVKIDAYTVPYGGYGKISNLSFTVACDHVHSTFVKSVAATCTEDGYDLYDCSDCGYTYKTDIVPATGHSYDSSFCVTCGAKKLEAFDDFFYGMGAYLTAENDASYPWTAVEECLVSGNKGVHNSNSTITLTAETSGTLTFDYWAEGEGAYDYFYVELNGAKTEYKGSGMSASVHEGSLRFTLAENDVLKLVFRKDSSGNAGADCAKVWNIVYTPDCTHEHKTQTSHTNATCTEAETTTYICDDCGKTFVETMGAPLGHAFTEFVETVAPTCTEQGYDAYACAHDGCGETEHQNLVDALGHTFGDGDTCTVCGAPKAWDGVSTNQPNQQDGYYLIGTGEELAWFAEQVNSSVSNTRLNAKLTANIDLGDHDWTPIGNYYSSSASYSRVYSGTFDGDGHKITGLNVQGTSASQAVGLFGYVSGGTIRNLSVDGTVTAYSTAYTGGVAGGIVGESNGITLDNCSNYAAVTGRMAGGLVGQVTANSGRTALTVTNCYNAGTVTGTLSSGNAGGLCGLITAITSTAGFSGTDRFENCFNFGTMSGSGTFGTIWGYHNTYGSVVPAANNCYYLTGSGSYSSTYTKGEAKTADEFQTLASDLGDTFVDNAALGHPVLVWEAPAEVSHEHTYTYTSNGDGTHTKTCTDPDCGETVVESCVLNANGECTLCGWKKPGSVSNPIEISTAAQLQALANEVNGVGEDGKAVAPDSKAGVYYVLTADITLDGSFTPIGRYNSSTFSEYAFSGHFDGQGHTVTLNITDRTGSNARVGLFGSVVGTEDSPAVVENVIVNGTVTAENGGSCVAGLIGYAHYAEIHNCGNAAAVTNKAGTAPSNGAAGILGRSGSITGSYGSVTISGCFNVGAIAADGYAAGIVYDAHQATAIENCYDMGTLTATSTDGFTGGIVAVPNVGKAVSLTNCYAAGTYTATHPGAVIGTISQAMTLSNVYYQGTKWIGSETYGWSGSAPTAVSSLSELASKLGGGFQAGADYPLLSWQDGAVAPTVPSEAHTHTYTDVVTAPTCTTQGYTTHTCAECGYSYTDSYVAALGHDLGEAAGNGNGTHSHTCSVCGEVVTESCTYDNGTVTTAPSKDTEGVMTYTCTVCGDTRTEVIPANDFLGSGTQADPFLLSSAEDLNTLAGNVNDGNSYAGQYFLLTDDVTLNSWTPIGTNTAPFSGVFTGGYHTVDITLNNTSRDFNGLFGAIENAIVEKVIITGSITGGSFTAGVAGYAYDSVIRYCGNQAAITGGDNHTFGKNQGPNDNYTGGIVGYATVDTVILSCYNKGTVYNNAPKSTTDNDGGAKYTGGIVGNLYEGSVQFCYNTGAVSINTASGTSYTYTGGIAGMSWSNSIMNSYSAGQISGGNFTGGVVGSTNLYHQQDAFSFYLEGSATAGTATGDDRVDYINSASAEALKSTTSTAGQCLGANFKENSDGGYLVLAWELDPTAEVTYLTKIYTKADLHLFLNSVRAGHDYYGETVVLMNDIDLEGRYSSANGAYSNAWTAIGDVHGTVFAGTFDGQGHTISNMLILNDYSGSLGLFSVLPQSATVKDLTVTGWAISAGDGSDSSCLGGIVGWNQGTVENCHSAVDIDAYNYYAVGGIVGDNAGMVTNCTNSGTVNGGYTTSRIGGVVGRCEPAYGYGDTETLFPSVTNCGNSGDVTGYQYVGGVIGAFFNEDSADVDLSVTNCYNTGDITGYDKVGGIIGQANLSELTLSNCYNSGTITGIPSSYYLDTCDTGTILGYGSAAVLNSYYLLCDMLPVGHGSGENYARPVSEEYMKTAEFAGMLGGAYQASENSTPILNP